MTSSEDPTCARIRELLPRRLDDALSPAELASVEEHLERCGSCREEAALLGRAADALRTLPEAERARLRERAYRELGLEADAAPRRSRLAHVVLTIVLFVLVYLWLRSRAPGKPLLGPASPETPSAR